MTKEGEKKKRILGKKERIKKEYKERKSEEKRI